MSKKSVFLERDDRVGNEEDAVLYTDGAKAQIVSVAQIEGVPLNRAIETKVLMPGPIRTEFFSSQGLSDAIFPEESFLSAEQLVAAALAGLAKGETVTTPTLANSETWDAMEAARGRYMSEVVSGAVAPRYLGPAES